MKIFSGSAHLELAQEIAKAIGVPLGKASVSSFPDGETFVKINENIRGRDVFVLQPTCPPTNQNIMELLIMVDAARRASAARITAVIPFFGYARQDRKDQPRVPITAKLVANLLVAAGVNRVLTLDLHADQLQGFFDIPVDHLYALPVFIEHLQQRDLGNTVVVAPDVGAIKMASSFAQALKRNLAFVSKKRISATEIEAVQVVGEIDGKNILLIDDMTETAGTLTSAARLLKERGALEIRAGVTHGLISSLASSRLINSPIEELICTNSTPAKSSDTPKVTVLSIAELLGQAIKRIHNSESVTRLFDVQGQKLNE